MFQQLLKIAIPFFWAGLLVAISFLEAPLKFQAPGITLQLGLDIGQLVFTALNRIEGVLTLLLIGAVLPLNGQTEPVNRREFGLYGLLIVLLLWQTLGLLPALNHRIELYQHHLTPKPSWAHVYYVGAEVAKLVILLWIGLQALSKTLKPYYHERYHQSHGS